MAYFKDLTPFRYHCTSSPAICVKWITGWRTLNVGWLDRNHPFPIGDVPESFLDGVFEQCHKHSSHHMRGFQRCSYCDVKNESQPFAIRNGIKIYLGDAEIWINGTNGKTYVAPNLIYHYIVEHKYMPPKEFIDAIILLKKEG